MRWTLNKIHYIGAGAPPSLAAVFAEGKTKALTPWQLVYILSVEVHEDWDVNNYLTQLELCRRLSLL